MSRPYAKLPFKADLELETIGFDTGQVDDYVNMAFTNPKTMVLDQEGASAVRSFLIGHQHIQDLMRIPIQLDAFCFTWDASKSSPAQLDTMTAVYQAMDLRLWKKDILRLEKTGERQLITSSHLETSTQSTIEGFVSKEISFLEALAFTGLYSYVIEFESAYLDRIKPRINFPDKVLPKLSFLQTSNSAPSSRSHHFLHLTYQEYFAVRYFVRPRPRVSPIIMEAVASSLGNNSSRGLKTAALSLFEHYHEDLVVTALAEYPAKTQSDTAQYKKEEAVVEQGKMGYVLLLIGQSIHNSGHVWFVERFYYHGNSKCGP
ncbi:hypothetical protein BP5796_12762 [Coleophoma crateriformis]|uniref:DUF7068 domain-containing protein n=1 Tax=Coleophoma crateriformis TaxID=565419 RepID=A0A3D8Q671_9HELO|nr:hypothetical protein BP5796_12762 [Coleophoma crateriformis]